MVSSTVEARMPRAQRLQMQDELRQRLRDYRFSHFITLASNFQPLSYQRMRDVLKAWDAQVNREINGPKWAKRPDERLLWFAFPEKLDVNPHWHLIAQVDSPIEEQARAERTKRLPQIGEKHWLRLVPRGSYDCQDVESPRVIDYVTKVAMREDLLARFIVCREFMNI
ncbi:hypothetical protein [Roseovarius ramblicola]|uniref:Transposase n=1 Tax=Roseovarius ramblicola TaxID=2022336 RepID=A0ABV5HX30_9RHOB